MPFLCTTAILLRIVKVGASTSFIRTLLLRTRRVESKGTLNPKPFRQSVFLTKVVFPLQNGDATKCMVMAFDDVASTLATRFCATVVEASKTALLFRGADDDDDDDASDAKVSPTKTFLTTAQNSVPFFFFCLMVVVGSAIVALLLAVLRGKRALTMRSLRRHGIATMEKRRKRIGWSLKSDVVSTRRRSGREDFETKEEREGKMHLVDRIEGWMSGNEEAWSLASGSGSTSRDDDGGDDDARSRIKNKRIFGATSSLFTGSCPFAHVGSSESARKILKEGGTEKMPAYSAFKRFAGNGLFTCANEEEWHEKRAEVLKAFGRVGVGKLRRVAEKWVKELVREIREKINKKGGDDDSGVMVTLLPLLQRVALRITFEYLCGISMEEACMRRSTNSKEKNTEFSSGNNCDDWKAIETEYLECSTILRRIIPARARSIWILSDFLYYTFSSVGREEKCAIEKAKLLAEIAVETCTEKSALREIINGKAHGKRATDAVEEATTLLFAGHDTQSATMCWGILELIKHEKIQEELRCSLRKKRRTEMEENNERHLRNSMSNEEEDNDEHGDEDEKDIATSARKPELEAVIRETLRLHPVAPLVVRQMKHHSVHLENGVTIPKGVAACVWLHAAHRDPAAWESPNTFKPSRWYEIHATDSMTTTSTTMPIKLKKTGKNYQPFASGQRSCVGQHVAMATLRVVFGQLLETFTFSENKRECPIQDEMVPSVGFTIAPQFGARVNVSEH